MAVGDQSRFGPNPALTVTDIGQPTVLSVTASWSKVTDVNVYFDFVRNVPPEFNAPDDMIVLDGKLYRMRWVETSESLLPPDGTATVSWSYGGLSGIVAADVPYTGNTVSLKLPWVVPSEIGTADTSTASFAVEITVTVAGVALPFGPEPLMGNSQPRLPADAKPTFVDWGFSEGNPQIVEGTPFIQGSILKANPVFEGTLGAPIETIQISFGGTVSQPLAGYWYLSGGVRIPPGGLTLNTSGTFSIGAIATDTRGRTTGVNTTLTVEEYTPPALTWDAARVDENGLPDAAGDHITVTLVTQVHHLAGLNSQQIKVYTRPYGDAVWTLAGTITPPALEYTGTLNLTGTFDPLQAWEVRVDLLDAATLLRDVKTVPSSGMIVDSDRGHVAIGQSVDPDGAPMQLRGPAKVYGDLQADNLVLHRQSGIKPAGNTIATVPLSGFTAVPEVRLTVEYNSTTAVSAWIGSVTETALTIRTSNASALVHYVAEQHPWRGVPIHAVKEPTYFATPVPSPHTYLFVGKYIPSGAQQTVAANGSSAQRFVVSATGALELPFRGDTRAQFENDILVAWCAPESGTVTGAGVSAAGAIPWLGAFRFEIYPGKIPAQDAREILRRLARQAGVAVTLGPQFD